MRQWIIGPQLHQALIDYQALRVVAFESEVVSHDAQHVNVIRLVLKDLAKETDFEIELALFSHAGQRIAGGSMFGSLVRELTLLCHLLPPAVGASREAGRPHGLSTPSRVPF